MIKATIDNRPVKVLLSKQQIKTRIEELGKDVTKDYADKDVVLIGVLTGCFIFMADFSRALDLDCEIGFMQISSYGDEMASSGKVTVKQELNTDIKGKDVIIVEDIVDSGRSLKFLRDYLKAFEPASMKVVTLLNKPNAHQVDVEIDYTGFNITDEFVIGYGLDLAGKKRNLNHIYQVITEE